MNFLISYLIIVEIYALAALSTNLLMGIIGIFSVSQAAVFGIGAYVYALSALNGIDFIPAALLAIVICATFNVLTSLPSLRLAGDYFVVTAFGIQIVMTAVFINWAEVTNGSTGIPNIPPARFFGYVAETPVEFLILATVCLGLGSLAFWLMMRSVYGRILHAIRIDEIAVAAAGRNVLWSKLGTSAVSGALAALAGVLFAAYFAFIDPLSYDIHVSIIFVTMLVVGGARTLIGSIIGPLILLAIPQLLAIVDVPTMIAGPIRQLVYGLILVVFMLWRPQGIAGKKL